MNAMSVALPNTYHQPVRGGTGCSSIRRVNENSPLRSSSQSTVRRSQPMSDDRDRAGEDLHLPIVHAHGVLRKRLGRRSGGAGPVGVVHAAVTGTEEELRVGDPAHRAAEVGTVHRERGEPLGG